MVRSGSAGPQATKGPDFLFIRHGETDWNLEGRLQGQTDIRLNPKGRAQASEAGRRAAQLFRERGWLLEESGFVGSPLERTRETMLQVRAAMGLDGHGFGLDPRLQELSFGAWEGLTWPEIKLQDPECLKARRRDTWNFVPPGGESYAMLAERVRPWLAELADRSVVVSHGGVARALMVLIGGASTASAPSTEVLQGRVLWFRNRGFGWL